LAERADGRDPQPDRLPSPRDRRLVDQWNSPAGTQRDRRCPGEGDPGLGSGVVSTASRNPVQGKERILASAIVGTTIEWYDFYLYGTAAALIFNVQFFPLESELGSLLASFATLAVGFFARPLGGIIAGHLGDRVGRKALLVVSLLSMGIASTLIGLVPNFSAIGWWAAAALVVLRIVQGLSAGAEWGGSALLSVEHAPASKRGLFGSF